MLQQLVADRAMSAVNGTAFAVTPALRESYAEGDDDELADVALREAALASVRLLAGAADEAGSDVAGQAAPASGLPPRRAVLVTEVDGATARPDTATAEPAVLAAMDAVDAADLGDEDAELTVGDAQDHDLAWYATQELPFLLELL